MHINIGLNDARRIVLQLAQSRNENVGPCQRVGGGNLVSRQARLGQGLVVEFAFHRIPRQESGDESRHSEDHHHGGGKNDDNLDLQTQAPNIPFTPSILKLPLLPEGNHRPPRTRGSGPCATTDFEVN